jgi:hypothetical protein
MATYDELLQAAGNTNLLNKVRVATFVSATNIMTESNATANHVNRMLWAKSVFAEPTLAGSRMMWPVLAQNKAATLAAITGASDATVQTAVDAAVDVFATGA